MQKSHILLTGERGVGKSTLIQRLLKEADMAVYGFVTKREAADAAGFHPIYIHPAGQPKEARCHTEENLAGMCDRKTHTVHLAAFDGLGVRYLEAAQPDGILVMDELGFMEAEAERFKRAVFRALDGEFPVLAAVKAREDVPFLNDILHHREATVYTVTPENREAIYTELLPLLRIWKTHCV